MSLTITTADGRFSYQLTDEDVLWLGRMAHWEGGRDPADTIWTMVQAYVQPEKHRPYPTFGQFLQAYSQPINPRWSRTGEFCRPGGRYHGRDECSEARLARRDRARAMPWEAVKSTVRAKIASLEAGTLPNGVPRAVEFADPAVSASYLRRNPAARTVKRAGNWFIATANSQRWPSGHVLVNGVAPPPEPSGGSVIAMLIAGTGIAWAVAQALASAR